MNLAVRFRNKIYLKINHKNQNWLAIFIGQTGTGKSYSALSTANLFSKRGLTVKHHVIFTAKQFLSLLNNPKNIQKGDIIVFDEAGVGMSSREWYSLQNKILGRVLQTFRFMNIGVIFTVPAMIMIDKQARTLFHNIFETLPNGIDRRNQTCYCKVHDYEYNNAYDKFFRKTITFPDNTGYPVKLMGIKIPIPPKEIIGEYERYKQKYAKELYAESQTQLDSIESKKKKYNRPVCAECGSKSIMCSKKGWYCRICGASGQGRPETYA